MNTAGQQGAALAIALALLAGIGTLALAAAATALASLAIAGYQQSQLAAFEAAESGIAWLLEPGAPLRLSTETTTATAEAAGSGAPPAGFSLGEPANALVSRHYRIISQGRATRNASVVLEQGYRVIGPASP